MNDTLKAAGRIGAELGAAKAEVERLARTYEVKPDGQDDTATGSRRWLCKFEQVSAA
jgi:hypothetical protein